MSCLYDANGPVSLTRRLLVRPVLVILLRYCRRFYVAILVVAVLTYRSLLHRPLITAKNPYPVYIDTCIGDHIFTVVGLYRVRSKVRVSVSYDFMDFLLQFVAFTAYSV